MTVQQLREMIAADLLKLRKKRSVAGWAIVLTAGISVVFYAYLVIAHATDPHHHGPAGGLRHFSNAFSTLGLDFGTIAAILIGVEAGAGESDDGIFRELAVTGRSRLLLFVTRIPAAVIVTLIVVASGLAIATLVTYLFAGGDPTPSAGLVVKSVGWVLLANSVVCIVAVGLGALTGSRPAALISLIAWQTIATRLLLDTTALGGARKAVLDAALTQLKPGPHGRGVTMSALLAVLVIALWAATATTLGAWRTRTRDA
jgi:ABC-type transport system involved in multi-copper enzyme maturation permease subunit